LGIAHETTFPYAPFNGKQESFWNGIEARLLPMLKGAPSPRLGRPCPSSAELKMAFTAETGRTQRRSDGTISLKGIRFEIPSRYHHFQRLSVRAASWDLSQVHLADPKTGAILCRLFPLDKQKNAQGERSVKGSPVDKPAAAVSPAPFSMAPLLQKLIQQYAITGLPPAYLPKQQSNTAHE
jgi:putative transposase